MSKWFDWTATEYQGRRAANRSSKYIEIVNDVENIIRSSADSLINGDAHVVARMIVSRLAHVHHLSPPADPAPKSS